MEEAAEAEDGWLREREERKGKEGTAREDASVLPLELLRVAMEVTEATSKEKETEGAPGARTLPAREKGE